MFKSVILCQIFSLLSLYVGVINIKCDTSNGCIKFHGEVPKGFMEVIQNSYGGITNGISLIENNIPGRYVE